MLVITTIITIISLIIASITDIKTREVPDWLNYSLIIIGISIHGIYSLIFSNPHYILSSIYGASLFLIIALVMFKTGQWGGGDSKMLIALGALIGLELNFKTFLLGFLINVLFIGAIYGVFWGIGLSLKNKKKFSKELKKVLNKKYVKVTIKILPFIAIFPFLLLLFKFSEILFILALIIFFITTLFFLTIIFSKVIENAFMYKSVSPKKLTEGDWIDKEVKINGKLICGPKDLGISQKQINKLIKLKVKKVKIKEGIPFIPPFLISFIFTLVFGNLFSLLI